MQNKMELNINSLIKDDVKIDELEIETLKMKLIEKKVRKAIIKDEKGEYSLDDTDIKYLSDSTNLTFADNFSYEDLVLVLKVKELPNNHLVKLDTINNISLNGIFNYNPSDIIIIEPLKDHINDVTRLITLDTRLKSNLELSNKAIVLVSNEANLDISALKDYHILKYKGDLKIVLNKLLIMLGFKPQELTDKGFSNNDNNKILHNYILEKYPSKLPIDVLETLEERQAKELSVRDEVLSIIRKGNVLIFDDIIITPDELVLLAEHYKSIHNPLDIDLNKIDFKDFVNIYGVRISRDGIYLLDDDSIANKGYAKPEIVDKLYEIYLVVKKNYKEKLRLLNNRKKVLNSIEIDQFDKKANLSDKELDKLYQEYIKLNLKASVKEFMQDIGIRINQTGIYLLDEDETIKLRDFIGIKEEEKIANILKDRFDEDCLTETEKNFGVKLEKINSIDLSFDGLEGVENYFSR